MDRFRRSGAIGLRQESARTRFLRAASIGLIVGLFGIGLSIVPAVRALEESVGLRLLFSVRSSTSVPPPAPVVIVSIDDTTPIRGYLPTRVSEWPRSIHGELVDRLTQLGATAIAFDIEFFRNGDPNEDARFADAMQRSGRVVLVRRFRVTDTDGYSMWERQDPIPPLARAAAAIAPAPLPDAALVSSYWTFLRTPVMGDVATLPTAMLQVHSLRQNIPLGELPPVAHFNFYGPPGTVCTIPYDAVIADPPISSACSIDGRAVFVGAGFARTRRSDQLDSYHTVYPLNEDDRRDGIDFSGVELHATAFGNLLMGNALRPAGGLLQLMTLLTFGYFVGSGTYLARTRNRYSKAAFVGRAYAVCAAMVLALVYAVILYLSFTALYVVVPVVTVLIGQFVVGTVLALVVPPVVHSECTRCVCLSTDIQGSTATNETTPPAVVAPIVRLYEKQLDATIEAFGGEPVALRGDGKTCIWLFGRSPRRASSQTHRTRSSPDADIRLRACLAALAAHQLLNQQRSHDQMNGVALPTRLAIDIGKVWVQAEADRRVINVWGHSADVAARLQKLNREIRGSVLATRRVTRDLDDSLITRRLGDFELEGLSRRFSVVEILTVPARVTDRDRELCRRFEDALTTYEAGRVVESKSAFEGISRDFPRDGPTRWYVNKLQTLSSAITESKPVAV